MSGYNPAPSIAPGGWFNAHSDAWSNYKPEIPKSPGRKLIIPKCTADTLLEEDLPTKINTPEKGKLFGLIPVDVLNDIIIWLIRLENNNKFMTYVACIKIPRNPVLHMRTYKYWQHYLYSGNFLLYHTIEYKCAHRRYVNIPCGFGPEMHLVKH